MSKKKGGSWRRSTVGRMFQWGLTKKVPDAPSLEPIADAASESAMMAAKEEEKKRLRGVAGRRSLIMTGGRGVLEPIDTKKKKLLGE